MRALQKRRRINRRELTRRIISIVAVIIVVVFLLGMFLTPLVHAKTVSIGDLQQQYSALEQKQKAVESQLEANKNQQQSGQQQLSDIGQNISYLQQQIENLNEQISTANAGILAKQQEIAAKQREIDRNYTLFKQRLCAMYMAGDVSYIDVLLSSDSVTEFLMRVDTVRYIALHDTELIDQLQNDKSQIEQAQKEIEQGKRSLQSASVSLASKQETLQSQQGEQTALLTQLKNTGSQLTQQKADYSAQEDEVNSQIQAAIKAAMRAEAAKKAASKASASAGSASGSNSGSGGAASTGKMLWPVSSHTISCSYGPRINPYTHKSGFHDGVDIAASMGAPIYAAASGTVRLDLGIAAANMEAVYGNSYVFIEHDNGVITFYGHCARRAAGLADGQTVKRGQVIAYVGSQGYSTGPHLHFGVYVNGDAQNPLKYIS